MNLEPAPRLPKWIFFAIDAGLLIAAFIIVYFNAKNPYAPLPFVSAVLCVALAAIIGAIPFLIDYAADSAEYVQQERERITEQVQRLHVAGESLARAAAHIKAVEEAVHKTAHAAENLPYRMQEKLAEFNASLAEKEESDYESLEQELVELRAANSEQLKAVAEKIERATTDLTALEAATRKQLAAAEAAVTRIQHAASDTAGKFETKIGATLATLDAKLAAIAAVNPGAPAVSPSPSPSSSGPQRESSPLPAPVQEAKPQTLAKPPALVESVEFIGTNPAPTPVASTEELTAKKTRIPRKPRPEGAPPPIADPAAPPVEEDIISGGFPLAEARDEQNSTPANAESFRLEPEEPATSSDGATRLLVTAYIGIGNKLFVRGDGPGLSRDKGVPMHFVSIGKWGWSTDSATAPVRCELYKNDETAALTGEVMLHPGKHVEVTALF